jgi:hypothetical protein
VVLPPGSVITAVVALVKVTLTGATLPFTIWCGRHAPVSVIPLPKLNQVAESRSGSGVCS